MKSLNWRRMLGLSFVICVLVLVMVAHFVGADRVAVHVNATGLSSDLLASLLVGPDELPWDTILATCRVGSDATPEVMHGFKGQSKFDETWSGRPTLKPGGLNSPDESVRISAAVTNSPAEAVSVVEDELANVAAAIPEITQEGSTASFADRAWQRGGRMLFTRGNIVGDIHMSRKEGVDRQSLLALAAVLGRKINAALAGKPETVPIMPLAADQELRVDLETAWKMRDLGTRLWGADSVTIAIYDANGIPRALPAKRVGEDQYLIPLRHLAAILGPKARVKITRDEVKTTLMGKALVFNNGAAEMRVDQQPVQLDRAVELAEGEALIPITSVVRDALGKTITWEKRGTVAVGRVK